MPTLKKEFEKKEFGFKGHSGPLGKAKPKILQQFYDNAKKKNYEPHLEMFEDETAEQAQENEDKKANDFNAKNSALLENLSSHNASAAPEAQKQS